MTKAVFISGTDTDVGKTVVSALLCRFLRERGLTVGYYKPVQSGAIAFDRSLNKWISPDCQLVTQIAPQTITRCSYSLPLPAAPQLAAEHITPPVEIDANKLDCDLHSLQQCCEVAIVEGAGGLAVPLTSQLAISDLVKRWNIPLVLVSRPNLGTINHTVLAIAYCHQLQLPLLATVMAYSTADLDPGDPVLASAPRFIRQLAGDSPLFQLPFVRLQTPKSSLSWQQARESLCPLIDTILTMNN